MNFTQRNKRKLSTEEFNQMKAYKSFVNSAKDKQNVKESVFDEVKKVYGDKWYNLKEGTRKVVDRLCWHVTERGFVFESAESLADLYDVSPSTVNNVIKYLSKHGIIYTVYRPSRKHNGLGNPVRLFTCHEYFTYWNEFLGLNYEANNKADCKAENIEIPTETSHRDVKKVSTYSLPSSFKQNNTSLDTVNHPRALRQAIPTVIYEAMAPYFDTDRLYKTYGVLLRAKAKVDKQKRITVEEYGNMYVDVFLNAIRLYKQGKVRKSLESLLYASWSSLTSQISRQINKPIGRLGIFEALLEC